MRHFPWLIIIAALALIACNGAAVSADSDGCAVPSPVGWDCSGLCETPYVAGGERCEEVVGCGASTRRILVADLQDQAVLMPPAGYPEDSCCTEGAVENISSVWVPAGVHAAVLTTPGRGVVGEPWYCADPTETPRCLEVDGGARGARAWVLTAPGADAGWVRVVMNGRCT